jgi:hypothetical protein
MLRSMAVPFTATGRTTIVHLSNVTITDANASSALPTASSVAAGGGVALHTSEAVLLNTRIEQCRAKTQGGGLFANKPLLHILQSTFDSNSALDGAALLYESVRSDVDPPSIVRHTRFEHNVAPTGGSIINYLRARMEWECQQNHYIPEVDRIQRNFDGCARPCAPGTVWSTVITAPQNAATTAPLAPWLLL